MTGLRRGRKLLAATGFGLAALAFGTISTSASFNVLGISVIPDDGAATLTPQLAACPTLDIPGANPSVKGTGFSHLSKVTLTWDGATVATTTSTSSGTFTKSFFVPAAVYGTHTVVAMDAHGVKATQLVRVSGYTCFSTSGTASLTVKWGVGGVDAHRASSILFNGAIVHQTTTTSTGGVNTTFNAPCQHGTTSWVVHVIQGGKPASASGTFTPTC